MNKAITTLFEHYKTLHISPYPCYPATSAHVWIVTWKHWRHGSELGTKQLPVTQVWSAELATRSNSAFRETNILNLFLENYKIVIIKG